LIHISISFSLRGDFSFFGFFPPLLFLKGVEGTFPPSQTQVEFSSSWGLLFFSSRPGLWFLCSVLLFFPPGYFRPPFFCALLNSPPPGNRLLQSFLFPCPAGRFPGPRLPPFPRSKPRRDFFVILKDRDSPPPPLLDSKKRQDCFFPPPFPQMS